MSKKRLPMLLLPALIFLSIKIIAQSPGSIDGQAFWLKSPHATGNADQKILNFNAAIAIDKGDMQVNLPPKINSLRRLTIFTVYLGADITREELPIWEMKGDFGDLLLSTGQVSSKSGRSNFVFKNKEGMTQWEKPLPIIHTYSAFNINSTTFAKPVANDGFIQLGNYGAGTTGVDQSRLIPEMILYDRILEEIEIDKIETYLALKYGITLEKNYVSAAGKIIWSHENENIYSNNIAGIGRNDQSALYQKQSTSSNFPGELIIGVKQIASSNLMNAGELNNDEYLIWGDNGKNFSLANIDANKNEGFQLLEKSWLMKITGNGNSSGITQLKLDVRNLIHQIKKERLLYLIIDRTGTGDFSSTQRTYIKADNISEEGIATFNNIAWDTDVSGKDVFTFGLKNTSIPTSPSNNKSNDDGHIYFQLYPNPVSHGQYKLTVNLDKPGDVIIQIYDMSQQLIETLKGKGNSTYLFSGTLKAPAGPYTVRLKTGHSELYRMLILQ